MSAINVLRQSGAVHVFTDGAAYGADGALLHVGPKAWPLPHLKAVVACRGPELIGPLAASYLSASTRSYELLRQNAGRIGRSLMESFGHLLELCSHGGDFEFVVAGFSELSGPDSYLVCNHDRYGVPPWTVIELGAFSLLPSSDAIHAAFAAGLKPGATADDLDPEVEGLRAMEAQRSAAVSLQRDESLVIVGGFAQMTTITPDGISTKVLKRWPDQFGKPIGSQELEAVQ